MIDKRILEELDEAWKSTGFMGKMRRLEFDETLYRNLLATLRAVEIPDGPVIDRKLVSLIWFMPEQLRRHCNRHISVTGMPEEEASRIILGVEELVGKILSYDGPTLPLQPPVPA